MLERENMIYITISPLFNDMRNSKSFCLCCPTSALYDIKLIVTNIS